MNRLPTGNMDNPELASLPWKYQVCVRGVVTGAGSPKALNPQIRDSVAPSFKPT